MESPVLSISQGSKPKPSWNRDVLLSLAEQHAIELAASLRSRETSFPDLFHRVDRLLTTVCWAADAEREEGAR